MPGQSTFVFSGLCGTAGPLPDLLMRCDLVSGTKPVMLQYRAISFYMRLFLVNNILNPMAWWIQLAVSFCHCVYRAEYQLCIFF